MANINVESNGDVAMVSLDGEMTDNQKLSFEEFMLEWQNEVVEVIQDLAKDLGISDGAAQDIFYLRTRSRWTKEKEDYLVWLDLNGQPYPNMMEDFDVPENYRSE